MESSGFQVKGGGSRRKSSDATVCLRHSASQTFKDIHKVHFTDKHHFHLLDVHAYFLCWPGIRVFFVPFLNITSQNTIITISWHCLAVNDVIISNHDFDSKSIVDEILGVTCLE